MNIHSLNKKINAINQANAFAKKQSERDLTSAAISEIRLALFYFTCKAKITLTPEVSRRICDLAKSRLSEVPYHTMTEVIRVSVNSFILIEGAS